MITLSSKLPQNEIDVQRRSSFTVTALTERLDAPYVTLKLKVKIQTEISKQSMPQLVFQQTDKPKDLWEFTMSKNQLQTDACNDE